MLFFPPVASLIGRLTSVPPVYIVLWFGSLALSVVLVVLLRTRWGQSRPLHKCAVLSMLVHLMLAWAAMTVRIIAGDGGGGSAGPPIRVRIVHEADPALALAKLADAAISETAPELFDSPEVDTEPPVADEPVASAEVAIDLSPGDEPSEPQPELASADAPQDESPSDDALQEPAAVNDVAEFDPAADSSVAIDQAKPTDTQSELDSSTAAAAPQAVEEASVSASAPTPYALRTAPGRLGLVERQGGNAQTEAAVAAALRWLAAAQSRDGRWDSNQFHAGQEQVVLGHNRGGAGRDADAGISSLALLAFLGTGHTHLHGEYQDTVRRGLDFLLRTQAADGNLFGDATLYAQMYCHSMATFALAEAQAISGDRRLESAVSRAVQFCIASQNATTGGWRYRAGDTGDTSQLGWQMMALASAERAGIGVPSHTWIRVERFLRSVRRGNYGGLASYRPDSGPTTAMTAEALYCRLLLAELQGESIDEPAATEATGAVAAALPDRERLNLYYWYYATLALHHRHQRNDRAAAEWRTWNEALIDALLNTQVTQGHGAGSWNTNTVWGGYGGRVYTTAMAAMCLEVYYRYAPPPAARDRWTATRPEPSQNSR